MIISRNLSKEYGFTLIELIAIVILLSILSVTLYSRVGIVGTAPIQSSRDDLIAALFFAQQQAMMRKNISVVLSAGSITVRENNADIPVSTDRYPLSLPAGVTLSPATLVYDKLGRTTATDITLTGSGNSSGVTAHVRVEASGYAFAN